MLRGPRVDEIPLDLQRLDGETMEQVMFRRDPLRWLEVFARDHGSADLYVEIEAHDDLHDVPAPIVEEAELVSA